MGNGKEIITIIGFQQLQSNSFVYRRISPMKNFLENLSSALESVVLCQIEIAQSVGTEAICSITL